MGKWSPVASALLFLSVALVYVANGRTIGSAIRSPRGTCRTAWFTSATPTSMSSRSSTTAGSPDLPRAGRDPVLSALSPGPLPLRVFSRSRAACPAGLRVPVLAGAPAGSWAARLEKFSAAAITALSVGACSGRSPGSSPDGGAGHRRHLRLRHQQLEREQPALWQHGPSQLFLALLLVVSSGMHDERWLTYAGFAASAAAAMRSTDLLVGLPSSPGCSGPARI